MFTMYHKGPDMLKIQLYNELVIWGHVSYFPGSRLPRRSGFSISASLPSSELSSESSKFLSLYFGYILTRNGGQAIDFFSISHYHYIKYRVGQKEVYSCEYTEHSLFSCYYSLIIVAFSIWTTVNPFFPRPAYTFWTGRVQRHYQRAFWCHLCF